MKWTMKKDLNFVSKFCFNGISSNLPNIEIKRDQQCIGTIDRSLMFERPSGWILEWINFQQGKLILGGHLNSENILTNDLSHLPL